MWTTVYCFRIYIGYCFSSGRRNREEVPMSRKSYCFFEPLSCNMEQHFVMAFGYDFHGETLSKDTVQS